MLILNILILILVIVGSIMSLFMLVGIICMAISQHNIRKYGRWWGKGMPEWLENIVGFFG